MNHVALKGTGSFLPERVVTNTELASTLETSDEWIQERVGIVERRMADPQDSVFSMALASAQAALAVAKCQAQDIDLIIVASCSQEQLFPSVACLIQQALGIPVCPAFDLQAACTGFIYALSIATHFIQSGSAKMALVIGSETMSRVVDPTDRSTGVLFGDGAGAVVLGVSAIPGIVSTNLNADGRLKDILSLAKNGYLQMDGKKVFRFAVSHLEQSARACLEVQNWAVSDLDWFIPHQANLRIIEPTAARLGISMDKVIVTLSKQGNTSAACIPLALDIAIRDGRIQAGHRILLAAVGGGATWGTALIQYGQNA